MKNVTNKTRAKVSGSLIKCPECGKVSKVIHFAWKALSCEHCHEIIEKKDWLLVEPFKDQSIFVDILEFDTPCGERLQAHRENGFVHIYKLNGDSFIHDAVINSAFNPKKIWDVYETL